MNPHYDILELVVIALGSHEYLHSDIDRLYNEHKLKYYQAYQESPFRHSETFSRYTMSKEERMKKVAGLIAWSYQNENFSLLDALIKKGYKFVWHYVNHNSALIIDQFILAYSKKRGGIEKVSELEMFNQTIIFHFLCLRNNMLYYSDTDYGKVVQDNFVRFLNNIRESKLAYTSAEIDKMDQMLNNYYLRDKDFPITVDKVFDKIILEEFRSHLNFNEVIGSREHDAISELVYKNGISQHVKIYSDFLQLLNADVTDLSSSIRLNKEDIYRILKNYLDNIDAKDYEAQAMQNQLVIANLFIYILVKEYQRAKEIHYKHYQNDLFDELSHLKNIIEEQSLQLQHEKIRLNRENDRYREENKRLNRQLQEIQKQNAILTAEMDNREEHAKEIVALRDFLYTSENPTVDDQTKNIEEKLVDLKKYKIGMIGGHPNWQKKLKEIMPAVILVNPDEINKDLAFIDRLDYLFINTSIFSHAFYERVMKQVGKSEVTLHYLNASGNIKISLQEMYQKIVKE